MPKRYSRSLNRKFGGKVFRNYHSYTGKQAKKFALATKTTLKADGWLTRVTKEYPDQYDVWYRRPDK